MGAAVLIRYAFNDRRLMDMYDQIGTPILVEDHKENKGHDLIKASLKKQLTSSFV